MHTVAHNVMHAYNRNHKKSSCRCACYTFSTIQCHRTQNIHSHNLQARELCTPTYLLQGNASSVVESSGGHLTRMYSFWFLGEGDDRTAWVESLYHRPTLSISWLSGFVRVTFQYPKTSHHPLPVECEMQHSPSSGMERNSNFYCHALATKCKGLAYYTNTHNVTLTTVSCIIKCILFTLYTSTTLLWQMGKLRIRNMEYMNWMCCS